MAKKVKNQPFEPAYYPDLPNFDMGRIERERAPSLYDDIARFLGQSWFGTDPQGMNKARRAVDVGSIAIPPVGMAIGANEITRNARQGKPPGEGLAGVLMSGLVPIPGAKAVAPELKKAAKTIEVPKSQLADDLKALKAQQSTPQSDPYEALDTYFKDVLYNDINEPMPEPIYDPPSPRISHGSSRGIDTTHISSHNFDEFDIGKVGVGEGTIMEGSGVYSSNDPHVPDYYTRQFTTANTKMFPYDLPKQSAAENITNSMLYMGPGTTEKQALASSIYDVESRLTSSDPYVSKDADKILKVLREWDKKGIPEGTIVRPYQYNVNLDADPAAMPEYRSTLPEQPEKARRLVRDAYLEYPGMTTEGMLDKSFEELYHDMYRANLAERGLSGPQHVGSIRFGKGAPGVAPVIQTKPEIVAKHFVEKYGGTHEAFEYLMEGGAGNLEPNLSQDVMTALSHWIESGADPLVPSTGKGLPEHAAADVSNYLYKRGIHGHKYLPAEGAYGDQGTRNFVSYHHEYMKILNKIKLALAAGVPTAVLASQYGKEDVEAAKQQQ